LSVFVVNPGSTSMKLALFEKGKALVSRELQYDKSDLARFERVMDQRDFRMSEIREFLLDPEEADCCTRCKAVFMKFPTTCSMI